MRHTAWLIISRPPAGVRDHFISRGFQVDLRLGQNPDEDIVYMARSSYFIESGALP